MALTAQRHQQEQAQYNGKYSMMTGNPTPSHYQERTMYQLQKQECYHRSTSHKQPMISEEHYVQPMVTLWYLNGTKRTTENPSPSAPETPKMSE